MKKVFIVILVSVFFNMVSLSVFAKTQEEKDKDLQRSVLIAIGGVCLVGMLFMAANMGHKDDFANPNSSSDNHAGNGSRIGFGFYNPGLGKSGSVKKEELKGIGLQFNYSW